MNDKEIKAWHQAKLSGRLMKAMQKRGFAVFYASTAGEAKKQVLAQLPAGAKIALAGSQTMEQIEVYSHLRGERPDDLIDPAGQTGLTPAENLALRKKMLTADILLTGTNAVDETGILYNIDGLGNRVAAMMFGPDKVVMAVGLNKVVSNDEDAWDRISNVAAPMNCKRLSRPNPCAETGYCHDCQTPTRICNYYTLIERSNPKERIVVILIGGEFGY